MYLFVTFSIVRSTFYKNLGPSTQVGTVVNIVIGYFKNLYTNPVSHFNIKIRQIFVQ